MAKIKHSLIPAGERHSPYNWIVADSSAKNAITAVVENDLNKTLLQLDTGVVYRLSSINPTVWVALSDQLNTINSATQSALDNKLDDADVGVTVQPYNANTVVDASYVHTDNNYTTTEKNKLDGIASGAEVNQNAFSFVAVSGQTTVEADAKTDTLTLVAGTNVTITTDSVNDTITINANDTSVDWSEIQNKPDPTITLAGDLSGSVTLTDLTSGTLTATIAENSVALGVDTTGDYLSAVTAGTGISVSGTASEGWNPTITNTAPNVTTDISITHNASDVVVNSSDGADGTINAATVSLAGVMSSSDKTKLNGIEAGAQVNTVTSVAGRTGAVTLSNSDVGLGNVTNDAQLKIASNLSDLNNAATARTNLGLGTAATKSIPATGNASTTEVVYGTDTRLSDAREWTASTVTQTEAETGTATTRRAWTAQRVRQAIVAWWNTIVGTVVQQSDIGTAPNEIPLNQYLGEVAYMNKNNFVISPVASAVPVGVGDMTFQLTSNTSLTVKVKGSDGVVRSTTLTLA